MKSFSFDSRIIDHLGSDGISSPRTAIIELIKNSRDAHATKVEVKIIRGEIEVYDNGDGMTQEDLDTKWMVIAQNNSRKMRNGKSASAEKGIGRLACQKLGSNLILQSIPKGSKNGWEMRFDWSKFKSGKKVEDVKFEDPSEFVANGEEKGVTLQIHELKSKWSSAEITKLRDEVAIEFLTAEDEGLDIMINNENVVKDTARIRKRVLGNAPFHLRASFDGEYLDVRIKNIWDIKNKGIYVKQDVRDIFQDYETGPFKLEVWHFPRAPGKVKTDFKEKYYESKIGIQMLEKFIRANYNMMIYRDDVWFKPYGTGKDWLNINEKKVQESWRLGTGEFYGIIKLSKEKNPKIRQSANRESIIENEAFEQLQEIIRDEILKILSKNRDAWKKKDKVKTKIDAGGSGDAEEDRKTILGNLLSTIRKTPMHPKDKKDIKLFVKGLIETTDDQLEDKKREVEQLGELSEWENNIVMVGIAASYMSRQVGESLTHNMAITRRGKEMHGTLSKIDAFGPKEKKIFDQMMKEGGEMLQNLGKNQDRMVHFMKFLTTMSRHVSDSRRKNYKPTQVDVWVCWNTVFDGFKDLKEELDITVIDRVDKLKVVMNEIDVECILTHLYLNSMESLKRTKGKREIEINFTHSKNTLILDFIDNGKGVPEKLKEKIFLPFELGHNPGDDEYHGHGLGLYFIKRIIDQNYFGGTATATNRKDKKFHIQIIFPDIQRVSR